MDLTADQEIYQVGDTARVLVQLPFEPAGQRLADHRAGHAPRAARGAAQRRQCQVIEIPITAAMAPNVHVTVAAVKGRHAGQQRPLRRRARGHGGTGCRSGPAGAERGPCRRK
jgi:uncharacterized protein YfaS (alpha-2-macroglobulin family)